MPDPFRLQRFVDAQNPIYPRVLAELRAGQKTSHWMWFVFPQIRGLGRSPTAIEYAISGAEEARAYLQHPLLGPRLVECTGLVNAIQGRGIHEIFGTPDDLKFRSSMTLFATLFARTSPDGQVFRDALKKYFDGVSDAATLETLGKN